MNQRLGTFLSRPWIYARTPSRRSLTWLLEAAAPVVRALPPSVRNQLADLVLKTPDLAKVGLLVADSPLAELLSWVRLVHVDDLPVLRRALVDLLLVPVSLASDARVGVGILPSSGAGSQLPAGARPSAKGGGQIDGSVGRPALGTWNSVPRHGNATVGRRLMRVRPGEESPWALPALTSSPGQASDPVLRLPAVAAGVLLGEAALSVHRVPPPIASLSSEAALGIWSPSETLQVAPRAFDRQNDFRTRFQWIGKVEDQMVRICRPYLLRLDLARLVASDVVHSRAEPQVLLSLEEQSSSLVNDATDSVSMRRILCGEVATAPLVTDLVSSLPFASQGFTQFIEERAAQAGNESTSLADSD